MLLHCPSTSRKRWGHADQGASAPLLPLCLAIGFQTAFALQSECLIAPPVNHYCFCCFEEWGLRFSSCLPATQTSLDHAFQILHVAGNPVNTSPVTVTGGTEIFLPALLIPHSTGAILAGSYPGTRIVIEPSESFHVLSEAWASQGHVVILVEGS